MKAQAPSSGSGRSQEEVSGCENIQVGKIRATPGNGNNKKKKKVVKQYHLDQRMAAGEFHV